MFRLKVFIVGVLVVGLMAGIAIPALAATSAGNSGEAIPVTDEGALAAIESVEAYAKCLELEEDNENMPTPDPTRCKIVGGFHGVWGTDDDSTTEPVGELYGVYGPRHRLGETCTVFKGVWTTEDGEIGGYLKGKCADGKFRGYWYRPENGAGGPIEGIYYPACSEYAADVPTRYFEGKWSTRDGETTGYLNGTWSPAVAWERDGKFKGEWVRGSELPADGTLRGFYGHIKLADGTTISYFKGKWTSNDGARGLLSGLTVNGSFCGVWKDRVGNPRGYLKGTYANHEFEGKWGHFGEEAEGRLWGTYGPLNTTPISIEKELTAIAG